MWKTYLKQTKNNAEEARELLKSHGRKKFIAQDSWSLNPTSYKRLFKFGNSVNMPDAYKDDGTEKVAMRLIGELEQMQGSYI